MPVSDGSKPFAGYIRVSQVKGRKGESFISPEQQRESIEKTARMHGLVLSEVVQELDVSGGKEAEARELGRLVEDVKAGRVGGIIVWNVKRYSRFWEDGLLVFHRLVKAGGRLLAEDFSHEGKYARSILSFLLENAEDEREQKTKVWDFATRKAVERGIHSGSIPPLGYAWPTTVIDLGEGRTRVKKLGPLQTTEDGWRIEAAHDALHDQASMSEVATILDVKSKSAAIKILRNRVYLGIAYSGKHEKHGAHPPLVSEQKFLRTQCLLDKRSGKNQEAVMHDTSKRETLLAKLLKCSGCGGSLTWDASMSKPGYRCHGNLHCKHRVTVAAEKIEPVVLDMALDWHRVTQPWFALTREVEDAMLPALMDALTAARAEVESLRNQIESGAISPSAGAVALTAAEKAVEDAREKVETAEAGTGWLSLTPGRVSEKLADADVETSRSFIGEMGTVTVYPVGRGHGKRPVRGRIRWNPATPVVDYAALPDGIMEEETAEFLAAVERYRAGDADDVRHVPPVAQVVVG
jgi:DNA invertase Pin-like site-specific DNA recombinase